MDAVERNQRRVVRIMRRMPRALRAVIEDQRVVQVVTKPENLIKVPKEKS